MHLHRSLLSAWIIAQLPCILETHKTYDDNFFYKSGEIGQVSPGMRLLLFVFCLGCRKRVANEWSVGLSTTCSMQVFIVTDKEEERKVLEEQEEVPNGVTPPNTNVVKRKYEKTKRHTPFPVRGNVFCCCCCCKPSKRWRRSGF